MTARYLVVADGAGGTLRERLGIGLHGPGPLQHWMNIIFDTDMSGRDRRQALHLVLRHRPQCDRHAASRRALAAGACSIFPRRARRRKISTPSERVRWCKPPRGARSRADLVDARAWTVAAQVADRFQRGRAFLVGDCAHLMPPTGAFGGNTGIHDAQNLAWKLALVLRGAAPPTLLDSYDAERRPVVERTLEQALARLQKWFKDPAGRLPPAVEIVEDYDVVFGQRYDAGAMLPEGPPPDRPFEPFRELSGRPGTRMPHVALDQAGSSTLDLPGDRPLLLTDDAGWAAAARDLAEGRRAAQMSSRRAGRGRRGSVSSGTERFSSGRTDSSLGGRRAADPPRPPNWPECWTPSWRTRAVDPSGIEMPAPPGALHDPALLRPEGGNEMTLKDSKVVIVGGSSGIGLGVAEALLAEGAWVTIVGRTVEKLRSAQDALGPAGRVRVIAADVTQEDQVRALFEESGMIDHLVVTRGTPPVGAPIASLDLDEVRRFVDLMLVSAISLAKHAAPKVRRGGSITFTSGISKDKPAVPGGAVVAAVAGSMGYLARALALELAPTRVNVVSPGWVKTPMWDDIAGAGKTRMWEEMGRRLPAGRIAKPADIAGAYSFLLGSAMTTGIVLKIDGGHALI